MRRCIYTRRAKITGLCEDASRRSYPLKTPVDLPPLDGLQETLVPRLIVTVAICYNNYTIVSQAFMIIIYNRDLPIKLLNMVEKQSDRV
jgi:hypothetical protein